MRKKYLSAGSLTMILFLSCVTHNAFALERNPFKFANSETSVTNKIKNTAGELTAILIFDEKKIAVIGDRLLKTGDMVDGALVIDITLDTVKTEKNGVSHLYELKVTK